MHYVEALLRSQEAAHASSAPSPSRSPDTRTSRGSAIESDDRQTQPTPRPTAEALEAARLRYEQQLDRLSARVLQVMQQRYFLVDDAIPNSRLVRDEFDRTDSDTSTH